MNALPLPQHFVEITDPHSADFERMLRIYEEALPANERKPRSVVEGLVKREDYRVVAVKAAEQLLSFLVVFVSATEDVALLEYLATSPHIRNQGLGAIMVAKAVELAGMRPLLFEVDSERDEAADSKLCLRRKNFYLRQGCRQIERLHYLMPQVGDTQPPAMDLLYHWKNHSTPPGRELIRCWLRTIYTEVYLRPADDPGIEAMTARL
ncbi:MAG: GNAT family N-acetyltransferase [Prosthecobacter sp.]